MRNKIAFMVVCVALALSCAPGAAQAGWVEFFFPSLAKKEPSPSETLTAPFALDENMQAPAAPAGTSLPVNAIPLDKPHRSAGAISAWMKDIVPDVMTIAGDDYKVELEKSTPMFDASGRAEFLAFLEEKGIMKVLQSQKYHVRSFVQDVPLVINQGEIGGVYHWLFEVPVMVTYLDRAMTDYKDVTPLSQKMTLTMQIGRSASAANAEGLLIERFSGKVQKIDKR